MDDSVTELDRHVPDLIKEALNQAYIAAQKAPGVARAVASEMQRSGLVDTAKDIATKAYIHYEPIGKELYVKYEPVAEHYAVSAWRKLNTFPMFPQVAHIVVPTAAYWSEKYNQTVLYTAKKGYLISCYLPLIPVERIAKVFGEEEELATTKPSKPISDSASSSSSDEDEAAPATKPTTTTTTTAPSSAPATKPTTTTTTTPSSAPAKTSKPSPVVAK